MIKKHKSDIVLICVLAVILIIVFILVNIPKTEGKYVRITIDDEVYGIYYLFEDITVELPTGNVVVIEEGEAYVSESTCKDKVCVNHIRISAYGEAIICLPNQVVVEIDKEAPDE